MRLLEQNVCLDWCPVRQMLLCLALLLLLIVWNKVELHSIIASITIGWTKFLTRVCLIICFFSEIKFSSVMYSYAFSWNMIFWWLRWVFNWTIIRYVQLWSFIICSLTDTVVFIATATAMCSLGHGLHTFTAVPRSTQPCILPGSQNLVPSFVKIRARMPALSGGR